MAAVVVRGAADRLPHSDSKTVCGAWVPRAWSSAIRHGTGSAGSAEAAASISGAISRSSSARAGEPHARTIASSALTSRASGSRGAAASQSASQSGRLTAKAASRMV